MLFLRSPAEVRKKCWNINSGGGSKQFEFRRVRSLFNLAHEPEKLLLNFWNKEQVIVLAGEYDNAKLNLFLKEAKGRIDKIKTSLSVEVRELSSDPNYELWE